MSIQHNNLTLLDMKQADVTGDRVIDRVFLFGHKSDELPGGFTEHITLVIQNGHSHTQATVNLPINAGYNPRLFLGDFDKDGIADILVTIDNGGSGGYISSYVYTDKNNVLRKLFDSESYNSYFKFNVNYENYYRVSVSSPQLDVLFILDISNKGHDYLAQYYNEDGTLKSPTAGEVLALGALYPIVTNEISMSYDLLALQRIIGTINADTLGYVENLLTWSGTHFIPARLAVSILPSKLIALY